MIALRIVPVELADEAAAAKRRDGAGVLVPAAGSTAWMEHGEGGEGWYTVNAAVVYMMCYGGFQRHAEGRRYVRCVVADDSEIVAEVGYIGGQLVALMVSHFSSPVDETDVFEDTPLLSLPNVREVPDALVQDVAQMLQHKTCEACGSPIMSVPGSGVEGCENPDCREYRTVTHAERIASRPVPLRRAA